MEQKLKIQFFKKLRRKTRKTGARASYAKNRIFQKIAKKQT